MANRTTFLPKLTPDGWRLNVPARFTEIGKRERYFYKTRELANGVAAELKEKRDKHGEAVKSILPSLGVTISTPSLPNCQYRTTVHG